MNQMRSAFSASMQSTRDILTSPEIAAGWREPSALAGFSIAGLAGHLLRAVGAVEAYLDRPLPELPPVSAAEYFVTILGTADLESPLHSNIRARGEEEGAVDHAALVARFDAQCAGLQQRLVDEPPERTIRAFKDIVLTLDDFLVTRIIEVVVHADDLASSVNQASPLFPREVTGIAIEAMVEIARLRHGDLAIVRALSRRERDPVDALRVF